MSKRTLGMLVALTAVVVIAGTLTWQRREAAVAASGASAPVFHGLAASINDVTRVVVRSAADGEVVLARAGDAWTVASKGGYPAAVEPIRRALIALTELETVEAKTTDPGRWSRLGVEDVADEGSTSKEVVLSDAGGKQLAALVIGKPRSTGALDELYVRKPGEDQAWLVSGELTLPTAASGWLERAITKIERDRVRAVTFERPDGETLRVERESTEQRDWTVADLGQRELRNATIANSLGNGLEFLELQDVRPAGEVDFTTDWLADATFECWNGLRVRVRTKEVDGTAWARFEAEHDASIVRDPAPEAASEGGDEAASQPAEPAEPAQDEAAAEQVRAEAAQLNAKLAPWAYALPQYNRTALTKRMKDLVKEPELGSDETPVVIPSTLPPEIQEQIKEHQESLGNKWVVKEPDPDGDSKLDIQDVTGGAPDAGGDAPPAPPAPPEDGGGG